MRGETILIVDDEFLIRWSLKQELSKLGFTVLEGETALEGISLLHEREPDLLILDQILPDGTGIDVLRGIHDEKGALPVIMLTAVGTSDIAVQAMKLGAYDYLTKPVNIEELKIVVEKALEATRLKRQIAHFLKSQEEHLGFCGMIGASEPMKKVFDTISKVAQSSGTTILLTGESGTGKELAAKAIHFLGSRRDQPLMTVNFSALTESIIESELFGHEKGAFTDANTQKKGIFELADGGTILLDEIGDISPKIQVKLLRVLEEKTFHRVGGTADINVDVRIIAATNRSLEQLVESNTFRSDLYYRLSVAPIMMPPLRDRGEDVLLLTDFFIQEFNSKFHKQFCGLSEETKKLFLEYNWPGNVREVKNILERAVLLHEGEYIAPSHVEFKQLQPSHAGQDASSSASTFYPAEHSLFEIEKNALMHALERAGGNQSRAAKLLKITRDTLRYRMKKYNLLS